MGGGGIYLLMGTWGVVVYLWPSRHMRMGVVCTRNQEVKSYLPPSLNTHPHPHPHPHAHAHPHAHPHRQPAPVTTRRSSLDQHRRPCVCTYMRTHTHTHTCTHTGDHEKKLPRPAPPSGLSALTRAPSSLSSAWGSCAYLHGRMCMGVSAWVYVHGRMCMGLCAWLASYGCMCMGVRACTHARTPMRMHPLTYSCTSVASSTPRHIQPPSYPPSSHWILLASMAPPLPLTS